MILELLPIVYLFFILAGIFIAFRRLDFAETKYQLHQVEDSYPRVSIIIPARNEAKNISSCLDSLLSLDYPNYEIILVDGNSTDNTVEIASHFEGVKIIQESPMPPNWVGKPWACHIGSQHAQGDVLLFTDADTTHGKNSLKKSVSKLHESDGFVTMVTTQIFVTFWEHLLTIVFLMISVTVNGTKGNDKAQIANGQYMLFTRETYIQIGGHEVAYDSIVEDLAIGTIASKLGYKPIIIIEHGLVKVRMYRNLADIFDGFTKNLGLGMKQVGLGGVLIAGIINIWATGYIFVILVNVLFYDQLTSSIIITSIIGYFSFLVLIFIGESKVSERGTGYVVLYPLYFLMFWLIVANSTIKTFFTKNIKWKDRNYPLTN